MFKKDSFVFGIILGILAPFLFYIVLHLLFYFIDTLFNTGKILQESNFQFLSLIANIFLIRVYFKNLKFEKTGKGLLIVTFAFIFFFMIFKEIKI
jgi:hypothetical protein